MITALQEASLVWDLSAEVTYNAGEELPFGLVLTAPSAGKYYLLGALYTSSAEFIPGTMFGILFTEGLEHCVNDPQHSSLWELDEGEEVNLPCIITLDRTNVILGIFMMRMAGDEPSLDDDEQAGTLAATLSGPHVVDIGQIMNLAIVVIMGGMVMAVALKE